MRTEVKPRKGKLRLRIEQDTDALNPRTEFDCHIGTMVCWHRRHRLGDEQPGDDPREWRIELADSIVGFKTNYPEDLPPEHIEAVLDKHVIMLPLYLYDHSGITMSTSAFSCPWDSGQVGWIYCTWEKAREEWGKDATVEQVEKCLRAEVKEYDNWLTGNVYGFIVERWDGDDWEHVDSCWGFYGDDPKTNGIAEHLGRHRKHLLKEV